LGIAAADLVALRNDLGRIIVRATITDRVRHGEVFVPMHWTGQYASDGRVDVLLHANTDPISGQPELKSSPVAIERFEPAWFAFAVTENKPELTAFGYAATSPCSGSGWRSELAGTIEPNSWDDLAQTLLFATPDRRVGASDASASGHQLLAYHDATTAQHRFAAFADGACIGLLFVAREPVAVSRTWAISQFGAELADSDRLRLLAGRPGAGVPDRGAIVCACFEVGQNDISSAITKQGATTVAAVGACTQAGTNCGSCRAEIGRLIHALTLAKAG
ncbi:MAG: molybdopterin dinucleotide binding domain-containing protein, partial [Pseudomonadota bacterium]